MNNELLAERAPAGTWRRLLERLLLLLLILLGFARLVWRLDAKNLWNDEIFSLMRAELNWLTDLRNIVVLEDGQDAVANLDPHPPAYFMLLGAFERLAGTSEFALRFPSVAASTLLVPAIWALGRRLARRRVLPPVAPIWAALFIAASPYYLWYGQEVRAYAQVAFLGILSTYLLLRALQQKTGRIRPGLFAGYVTVLAFLLGSHYFAVFILPVHVLLAFQTLWPANRRRAVLVAAGLLAIALLPISAAVYQLTVQAGAGSNFTGVSLRVLVPDIVNSFGPGPSANLVLAWPLDLVFAALALAGGVYSCLALRRRDPAALLLPAMVLLPVLLILAVNQVRPAYMNSRELSLISGAFLLLVGGGLAWLGQRLRFAAPLIASILVAAMVFSSRDYYFAPQFAKGDVAGMGTYLRDRLQAGDLLLLKPSGLMRLYRYYLPIDALAHGNEAGHGTGFRGLPLVADAPADQTPLLPGLTSPYRRVWVAEMAGEDEVDQWLGSHLFFVFDRHFENPAAPLKLRLFLVHPPAGESLPGATEHPMQAVFGAAGGGSIQLRGFVVGQALAPGYQLPVTLYWQLPAKVNRRYKYILRLLPPEGQRLRLPATEREPYDGALPTDRWPAGKTIVEYSGVASPSGGIGPGYRLALQVYDAETLQKLPVTGDDGSALAPDAETLILPLD